MSKKIILTIISLLFLICIPVLSAETMNSDSYRIQFGNFNMTSGEKSSSSYTLTDTVGQIAPGEYSGTGYVVKSGFQYIYPFRSLSLKLSKITVNLGELSPDTFSTDTHTIIVDTDGAGGYSVQAFEYHPLRLQSGSTVIPDTTCDAGTCTESTAQTWTTATNYGFGFNVAGDDESADFSSTNHFRQFADISNAETMKTIMSGSGINTNRNATVTYKVSTSGSQDAGLYETVVVYSLIPTY